MKPLHLRSIGGRRFSRSEFSPLRSIFATLRAGMVAGAAFVADDIDAAEHRSVSDVGLAMVHLQSNPKSSLPVHENPQE